MNYTFWNSWKKKSVTEKRYIDALQRSLKWLKEQPFAKDILAVYVKGSFAYRELNDKSDIDLVPIMKDEKSLNLLREIRNRNKDILKPVDILPFALGELEQNKYFKEPLPGTKGKPDQFTLLLSEHKIVYGKPLNSKGWKVRSDQKIYEALRDVIRDTQLPMYERRDFAFSQLIKQVMHLIWWEERLQGKKILSSWNAMNKSLPEHKLLQQTIRFRLHPTKDNKMREKYITQVKEYLEK